MATPKYKIIYIIQFAILLPIMVFIMWFILYYMGKSIYEDIKDPILCMCEEWYNPKRLMENSNVMTMCQLTTGDIVYKKCDWKRKSWWDI
jgi:hypothetical protein